MPLDFSKIPFWPARPHVMQDLIMNENDPISNRESFRAGKLSGIAKCEDAFTALVSSGKFGRVLSEEEIFEILNETIYLINRRKIALMISEAQKRIG